MITILNRNATPVPRSEWTPFWSWVDIINGYRRFWHLEEILLNVLLFIPFGVLLKAVTAIKWWQALLIGFGCSLIIETIQYFTCRGLFEWDDMIHNAVGCAIGAGITGMVMKISEEPGEKKFGLKQR